MRGGVVSHQYRIVIKKRANVCVCVCVIKLEKIPAGPPEADFKPI